MLVFTVAIENISHMNWYVAVFSFLVPSDSRSLKLREELFIFLLCYALNHMKPFKKSLCIQLEIRVRNESVSTPEFGKN